MRLLLDTPFAEILSHQRETNGLVTLPVLETHVLALEGLAGHHSDPFDRLLVAQAMVERAILVSADPVLAHYPAEVRW